MTGTDTCWNLDRVTVFGTSPRFLTEVHARGIRPRTLDRFTVAVYESLSKTSFVQLALHHSTRFGFYFQPGQYSLRLCLSGRKKLSAKACISHLTQAGRIYVLVVSRITR